MKAGHRRLAIAALVVGSLLAACGSSGISDAAAARLEPQVQTVRQAATSGQLGAARSGLADLRALAGELAATGEIDAAALERIQAAAADVEAGLALLDTTTTPPTVATTTTTAITTTTTTTEEPEQDEDEDQEEQDKEKQDKEEQQDDDDGEGQGNGPPPGRGNAPGGPGGGEDRD